MHILDLYFLIIALGQCIDNSDCPDKTLKQLCAVGSDMTPDDHDQLFCFLDVLGFKNLVMKVGLNALYEKYEELVKAAQAEQVDGVFFSSRAGHPYFGYQKIQTTYFSDTIIFWCPYDIHHLEVMTNSLKEVICRSIEIGLPLRGAISVGKAKLGPHQRIFLESLL